MLDEVFRLVHCTPIAGGKNIIGPCQIWTYSLHTGQMAAAPEVPVLPGAPGAEAADRPAVRARRSEVAGAARR
jgi:hypothetical protein